MADTTKGPPDAPLEGDEHCPGCGVPLMETDWVQHPIGDHPDDGFPVYERVCVRCTLANKEPRHAD